MALVIRITGEITESNFSEYEVMTQKIIDRINTDLVTDQDFANAKEDIKACKDVENQLTQAQQDATISMEDVSKMFTSIAKSQDKFRKTRLDLASKVKAEETKRKNQIVDDGIARLKRIFTGNPVGMPDNDQVRAAIKGKRSLAKMEEAVDAVIDEQEAALAVLLETFNTNLALINASEAQYPGLYPDKNTLASSATELVESKIESRVNSFKLAEKEKAEKAEAERKAEEEADAKEAAEAEVKAAQEAEAEQVFEESVAETETPAIPKPSELPAAELQTPSDLPETDFPSPPSMPELPSIPVSMAPLKQAVAQKGETWHCLCGLPLDTVEIDGFGTIRTCYAGCGRNWQIREISDSELM